MKTITKTIFLVSLTCAGLACGLRAQPALSEEYRFPNHAGDDVIVREDGAGVPVMAYHESAKVNFVYGEPFTGNARQLSIPHAYHPDGSVTRYRVKDMEVHDDVCYFCGVKYRSFASGVVDSIGVLGQIQLSPSTFSPMENYYLADVPSTRCLDRMAVYGSGGYVMIAMTGVADSIVHSDCLAMVKRVAPGGGWIYDLRVCNDHHERFTDIGFDAKNMVVVARRDGNDEDRYVYVHSTGTYDAMFYNNCADLNHRHRFEPDIAAPVSQYTMKHRHDADIRLCAIPWESQVHLVYECYGLSGSSPYATAVCRVESGLYPMTMDNLQIVEEGYVENGTIVDVKLVHDIHYSSFNYNIAVLHLPGSSVYPTVVEYPYGLVNDYGTNFHALTQSPTDHRFTSMNVYQGQSLRWGGRWDPVSSRLVYTRQVRQYLGTKDLCLNNDKAPVAVGDETLVADVFGVVLRKQYNVPQKYLWGDLHDVDTSPVTTELNCNR